MSLPSEVNRQMPENTSSKEVPVALLSQALVEFRAADGNLKIQREVAIRYFKSGITEGYELGPLLEWLLFWPNTRQSVFWQARLTARFAEILKKISLREIGVAPERDTN